MARPRYYAVRASISNTVVLRQAVARRRSAVSWAAMKIGFFGFNNGALAESEAMAQALRAMDDAGFESAWTGEHVVLIDPQEPPSPVPPDFPMLDTVAALAFAAGVTQRIRLASGIILLAQRNPVVLAKELSGIDRLSKGRLIFGVGVGYVPREFEVIGVPYRERGARVSEHIEAIRALWTQEQPDFERPLHANLRRAAAAHADSAAPSADHHRGHVRSRLPPRRAPRQRLVRLRPDR